MSTYPVSGERMPEHELHWIPNLFCTCILLTSVYKPLSLSCISQQVIGPSTHKRYERGREHLFLSFFSSLPFSPSPSHPAPAINLGGSLPLAWVAGTRRGGGEEGGGGEKCDRGRVWSFLSTLILGSFLFSPSPLVPTINLGGPSPLVWVAGTRGGGGRKGGKFERGREPFFCSSPFPLDSCHTSYSSYYGHSANIDSSWVPHKHYEMFDGNKLL